jgi:hypothetical protein
MPDINGQTAHGGTGEQQLQAVQTAEVVAGGTSSTPDKRARDHQRSHSGQVGDVGL